MDYRWAPCTIENTGFSSERRFEVKLADGKKVVGAAYIEYFQDGNKQPLPQGHPPFGQVIKGFVKCRLISREGSMASIEFPGTDVFQVSQETLASSCT